VLVAFPKRTCGSIAASPFLLSGTLYLRSQILRPPSPKTNHRLPGSPPSQPSGRHRPVLATRRCGRPNCPMPGRR